MASLSDGRKDFYEMHSPKIVNVLDRIVEEERPQLAPLSRKMYGKKEG